MNRKKLLVTASTFPRWEGDTEPRFILDVSKELNKYFDVTVLAPSAPGAADNEVLEGVKVIRYHYFPIHKWETLCYPGAIVPRIKEKKIRIILVPFLLLSLWIRLKKILPEYDMVHVNWLIPQGIIQSFFDKPYIVTGLGGDVSSLNKGWIYKLKKKCLGKARGITAVSNSLKEQIIEICPEAHPVVITMGCEVSAYGKKNRIDNYFNRSNRKKVLFVGRLAEKKGCKYLIQAMKDIDADLIIVGDGPLRSELESLSISTKVNATFLGAKTKEELKTIYASADMMVVPSITAVDGDKEGVPTAIIEAMASEIAIIASDSGGISDIVADGDNGLLVAEKDVGALHEKICILLDDEELRSSLAHQARLTSLKYDYTEIGRRYVEILNGICD